LRAARPTLGSMVDSYKPYHPKYLQNQGVTSNQMSQAPPTRGVAKDSIFMPDLSDD
jgi:hypothetical protein